MKSKLSILLCFFGILIIGVGLFVHAKEYIQVTITMVGMMFLCTGISFSDFLRKFFHQYRTKILITSIVVGSVLLILVFGLNINDTLGWFMTCVGIFALFTGLLSFKKIRAFILALIEAFL